MNATTRVPVRKRLQTSITGAVPQNYAIPDSEKYRTIYIQWRGGDAGTVVKAQAKVLAQATLFEDLSGLDTVMYSGDITASTGLIVINLASPMAGGINLNVASALSGTLTVDILLANSAHTTTPR